MVLLLSFKHLQDQKQTLCWWGPKNPSVQAQCLLRWLLNQSAARKHVSLRTDLNSYLGVQVLDLGVFAVQQY